MIGPTDTIRVLVATKPVDFGKGARLEDGKFRWPSVQDGGMRLSAAELSALLEGLDWKRVHPARFASCASSSPRRRRVNPST